MTIDTDLLTEYVRQALARQITRQYAGDEPVLKVLTISGKVEKVIADSIQQTENGNYLAIDPNDSKKILESAAAHIEKLLKVQQTPILLCSPAVRMYVRQLTERYFPQVPVLSYNELEADVEVQSIGMVNV